jgi:hypothetical protein
LKLKYWHPSVGVQEIEIDDDSPMAQIFGLTEADLKGLSMRPGLDHYVGRPFVSVFQSDNDDYDWAIELEGGVLIRNKDGRRTAAPTEEELGGTSLLLVTFSEMDTILHFGMSSAPGSTTVKEITLTPTQYTLSDAAVYGEVEIYPQVPDAEETVIPDDPSVDRVADGPDEAQVTHMIQPDAEAPENVAEAVEDDNA